MLYWPNAYQQGRPFLYHYETFNPQYLSDLLQSCHIHCSKLENLNDPWDCRPFFDDSFLADREQRKLAVGWFEESLPESESDQYKAFVRHRIENDENFARWTVQKFSAGFPNFLKDRNCIYCLTPYPDSTLMWSHYADHHRGICLEFSASNNKLFASAFQVFYREEYPRWPLHEINENMLKILLTKSADWRYEDEFRIIGRLNPGPEDKADGGLLLAQGGFLNFPKCALVAVIAGCQSSYDEISSLVADCAPGLPVKRAVRVLNHFRIRVENDSSG